MKIEYEYEKTERIVFHFNKAHNQDPTIPMWVVKHKGVTYYINHMDSEVGVNTKESPDNLHTKGSLQFRGKLQILLEDNGTRTAKIRG